ncbi:hypothetical protein PoB_007682300 [Plakobranchus ocellatus]|uniref:Uncharacterized protein n=1 Tax=Plakobranchus ocellatus TaxID=259542 RepID=A0AAV4E1W2_9GAST|nr:hypothetical protein PoB_007682300 [Plakobranchus ocellatus]
MKRVQAIVTGKKKQCTKMSKSEISNASRPEKETERSAATSLPIGPNNAKDAATVVVKPGPRSPQPGTRRLAASMESSPGMSRKGSGSKIPASSPKKEGLAKRPASPPKGRARKDLEQNSKPSKQSSKAQSLQQRFSKKPSVKEKRRKSESEIVPTSPTNGISAAAEKCLGRSNSTASKSGSRTNELLGAGVNQIEKSSTQKSGLQSAASSTSSDNQGENQRNLSQENSEAVSMPSGTSESPHVKDNEPRSRQPLSSDSAALPPISPPGGSTDKEDLRLDTQGNQNENSAKTLAQPLPPPPLHGILKESKTSNNDRKESTQRPGQVIYNRDTHNQPPDNSQCDSRAHPKHGDFQQQSCGQLPRSLSSSNSLRGSSDGVYSQIYFNAVPRQQGYTNHKIDKYGYNSLPRTSHPDGIPTNNLGNRNEFNSWGSLDRKIELDSGFGANALDRSFSSTSSSNYASYPPQHPPSLSAGHRQRRPLNYAASDGANYAMFTTSSGQRREIPPVIYAADNQPHNPSRPDSVPPLGSKTNLNNNIDDLYSNARPGSVPPQHPNNFYGYHSESDTKGEKYASSSSHRGYRAGSVPLGYESESAIYGFAHTPRIDQYNSDSGHSKPYQYPSSNRGPRGLRVHPNDERYRAKPGKKPIPRRHTVATPRRTESYPSDTVDYKDTLAENQGTLQINQNRLARNGEEKNHQDQNYFLPYVSVFIIAACVEKVSSGSFKINSRYLNVDKHESFCKHRQVNNIPLHHSIVLSLGLQWSPSMSSGQDKINEVTRDLQRSHRPDCLRRTWTCQFKSDQKKRSYLLAILGSPS